MKEKIAFLGLALLSLMTASCSCKSVPDSSSLPIEGSSSSPSSSASSSTSSSVSASSSSSSSDSSSSEDGVHFTVRFFTYDANRLIASLRVKQGETAVYAGVIPDRPETAQYYYLFDHWDADLTNVQRDIDTLAVYKAVTQRYDITFVNYDDSVIGNQKGVRYGEMPDFTGTPNPPARPSDGTYRYTFKGWSPELVPVAADATYKAIFASELL
jgi:uncharacterized protein YcfL